MLDTNQLPLRRHYPNWNRVVCGPFGQEPGTSVGGGRGVREQGNLDEGATSQSASEGGGRGVREQGQELWSDFVEVRKLERETRKVDKL